MANENHGQGRVTDPSTDGRLKENQDSEAGHAAAMSGRQAESDHGQAGHGQGRVTDPETDGRLKGNRDDSYGAKGKGSGSHASNGQGRVTDPAPMAA